MRGAGHDGERATEARSGGLPSAQEKHRAELAQHDAKAAEAAAAAAAANASTMGEAAAAVAAADQKLRLQVETAQGNAATMRSMVERAEALCQRLTVRAPCVAPAVGALCVRRLWLPHTDALRM